MASVALGVSVLFGWAVGSQSLKQLVAGAASMRPVTAVCFILLGCAIAALVTRGQWIRRLGSAAAVSAGLLAGVNLVAYVGGWNLLVDDVLFPELVNAEPHRGRMAPAAAVEILLLTSALMALALRRRVIAETFAALAFAGSAVAVLGYLYDARYLYADDARSSLALNTAVGLMVVSLGLLAAIPNGLLPRLLSPAGPGPLPSRRLLPVVTIVLPAIGWASLTGERDGWYSPGFEVSIMVVAAGALIIAAAWPAVLDVDRLLALVRHTWHELGKAASDPSLGRPPAPARRAAGPADQGPLHPGREGTPAPTHAAFVVQVELQNGEGDDRPPDPDPSRSDTTSSSPPAMDFDRMAQGVVDVLDAAAPTLHPRVQVELTTESETRTESIPADSPDPPTPDPILPTPDPISPDDLVLDLGRRSLLVDGQHMVLTRREFDLLAYLYHHRGAAHSRRELMDQVWRPGYPDDSRTLDIHIRRIRMKLGRHAHRVSTLRGFGYRFD